MTCPTQSWVNAEQTLFFLNGSQPLKIGTVTLSESSGVLLSNGVPIPSTWSIYNTESNIINFDDSNVLQIIGGFLYFNDQIIATQGDLSNISDWALYPAISSVQLLGQPLTWATGPIPQHLYMLDGTNGDLVYDGSSVLPSNWSKYVATQTVDLANNNLSNASNIYCSSIYGNVPTFNLQTPEYLYVKVGDLANITTESKVLIQTTGGTNGHIILEANGGGDGHIFPGIVELIANPVISPDGNAGTGGTVNIFANSAIGLNPALTQTSKVVVSGASVLSYAGYIAPVLSTAGYNYIWGSLGVNIQSDIVPPIAPNTAGTVYLYGRLGVAVGTGTVAGTEYGLFASLIQPYSDGVSRPDLIISGKFSANVKLRDVSEIVGDDCAMTNITSINGVPYVSGSQWSAYPATQAVNFFNYDLSNVSTINGVAYPPAGVDWWTVPAGGDVDMSGNSITNLVNINGAPYVSGSLWSSYPATQTVDMSGNGLNNADYVTAVTGTFTTIVESDLIGINNVVQIGYITKDTPGTGIQINSDNDISLRVGTAVGAPPGLVSNTGYYTTDILTPTHSNELTTKAYVDGLPNVSTWSSYPAGSDINVSGFSIYNLDKVAFGALTVGTPYFEPISFSGNTGVSFNCVAGAGIYNTGFYLTDVLTPTQSNELTTKQYVDGRSGVVSLNSLTGALSITAGSGITVTPSGTTVEVAMTQGPIKAYGNNTIAISALTTAAQNIAVVGSVITVGTSRLVGIATMTVLTNSNTIHDITYYLTLNGAQIGAQMKHSFNGSGHWNTLAVTAIATGIAASPTNVFRLVALADANSIFTVTAVNLNCTVDLA